MTVYMLHHASRWGDTRDATASLDPPSIPVVKCTAKFAVILAVCTSSLKATCTSIHPPCIIGMHRQMNSDLVMFLLQFCCTPAPVEWLYQHLLVG